LLSAANTFTAAQVFNAGLSATSFVGGTVSGSSVDSASGYTIQGVPHLTGNPSLQNVFVGPAGNNSDSGSDNVAIGTDALQSFSGGENNTALGSYMHLRTLPMALSISALAVQHSSTTPAAPVMWRLA
jgi:hypothetical protein